MPPAAVSYRLRAPALPGPASGKPAIAVAACRLAALVVLAASPGAALAQTGSASLSIASGSGDPGATGIVLAVSLASQAGAQVSGLNVDLSFDGSRLSVPSGPCNNVVAVVSGSAAQSAGKAILCSRPSASTVRIILFGLNQDAIPDGPVALITFEVLPGAPAGSSTLDLHNGAASAPDGSGVPLDLTDGAFSVNAPPANATATATHTPLSTAPPTAAGAAGGAAPHGGTAAAEPPSPTPWSALGEIPPEVETAAVATGTALAEAERARADSTATASAAEGTPTVSRVLVGSVGLIVFLIILGSIAYFAWRSRSAGPPSTEA